MKRELELNPAVLGLTDAKREDNNLSFNPIVFIVPGFEYSNIKNKTVPPNIKKAVIKESLKVGYHILEKYTDSVTIMRWVGA